MTLSSNIYLKIVEKTMFLSKKIKYFSKIFPIETGCNANRYQHKAQTDRPY